METENTDGDLLRQVANMERQHTDAEQGTRVPGIADMLDDHNRSILPLLVAMDEKIEQIRRTILEQQEKSIEKEWYTVAEAARLTGYRPYTIRQCCNLGRIPEEWRDKHHRRGDWRIRREAIDEIRNHGLPPVK